MWLFITFLSCWGFYTFLRVYSTLFPKLKVYTIAGLLRVWRYHLRDMDWLGTLNQYILMSSPVYKVTIDLFTCTGSSGKNVILSLRKREKEQQTNHDNKKSSFNTWFGNWLIMVNEHCQPAAVPTIAKETDIEMWTFYFLFKENNINNQVQQILTCLKQSLCWFLRGILLGSSRTAHGMTSNGDGD
jgi:hypothetical protein